MVKRVWFWAVAGLALAAVMAVLNARMFTNSLKRLFLANLELNVGFWAILVTLAAVASGTAGRAVLNCLTMTLVMCVTYYPLVVVMEELANALGHTVYRTPLIMLLQGNWYWFVAALLCAGIGWLIAMRQTNPAFSIVARILPLIAVAFQFWQTSQTFNDTVEQLTRGETDSISFVPPDWFDYTNRALTLAILLAFTAWWLRRWHLERTAQPM
ncbi:MAG: hypothetical protein LBR20_04520 [Propionibacteriaceae bacterium]|jgi:hypothetical protein|nr:hypothetical protein [Propionibacteriaceae bacterium]